MNELEIQTLVKELIITKNDKIIFLNSLSIIKETAYINNPTKIINKLKNTVPEKLFKFLKTIIHNAKTPSDLNSFITKIEKYVNNLPIINISLCYKPTREQIEQISFKIRTNTMQSAFIHYSINTNIIGTEINFNGKIYKKTIEGEFLK